MRKKLIEAIKNFNTNPEKNLKLIQVIINNMAKNAKDMAELKETPDKEDTLESNANEETLLMMAERTGSNELISLIKDAPIHLKGISIDNIGRTQLHIAALNGELKKVETLLNSPNGQSLLNAKDQYQASPLFLAAAGGHKDVIMLLIEHKADPKSSITIDRAGIGVSKHSTSIIPWMLDRERLGLFYPEKMILNQGQLASCIQTLADAKADLAANSESFYGNEPTPRDTSSLTLAIENNLPVEAILLIQLTKPDTNQLVSVLRDVLYNSRLYSILKEIIKLPACRELISSPDVHRDIVDQLSRGNKELFEILKDQGLLTEKIKQDSLQEAKTLNSRAPEVRKKSQEMVDILNNYTPSSTNVEKVGLFSQTRLDSKDSQQPAQAQQHGKDFKGP